MLHDRDMTAAVLYGASSGVVHAMTGPDHVLSLGPVALQHSRAGFRIGALWGLGHAAGTFALALPMLLLTHAVEFDALAGLGDRLAGAALLAKPARADRGRRLARHPLAAVGLASAEVRGGWITSVRPLWRQRGRLVTAAARLTGRHRQCRFCRLRCNRPRHHSAL